MPSSGRQTRLGMVVGVGRKVSEQTICAAKQRTLEPSEYYPNYIFFKFLRYYKITSKFLPSQISPLYGKWYGKILLKHPPEKLVKVGIGKLLTEANWPNLLAVSYLLLLMITLPAKRVKNVWVLYVSFPLFPQFTP